jgi:hypothetical protein
MGDAAAAGTEALVRKRLAVSSESALAREESAVGRVPQARLGPRLRPLVSALLRGLGVEIREHGLDGGALALGTTRMRFLVFGDVLLALERLAAFAAAVFIDWHGGLLHANFDTHARQVHANTFCVRMHYATITVAPNTAFQSKEVMQT